MAITITRTCLGRQSGADAERGNIMSEQICDICKKEPVRIQIKGQGQYCLKCYNAMNLERTGVDDTFHYPDTMAVWETNGRLHTFHIEHIIMGNTVCWDAFEQNGIYHFREISDIESNGAAAAQRFFRKIVEGVCTKSLCEFEHRADNLLYRDGKYISLRDKGTINIIEDKARGYQIGFEIDGFKFCGEELEKLLGGFQGFSMRYQIHNASDPILKEDEYLIPVYITKTSLIDELKTAINIYSDNGFISYKETFKFDQVFFKIIDKLEILAHSEKRDNALEAGRDMVRIMKSIETDDDYFPLYETELICKTVDPFGIDEELKRICGDLFS